MNDHWCERTRAGHPAPSTPLPAQSKSQLRLSPPAGQGILRSFQQLSQCFHFDHQFLVSHLSFDSDTPVCSMVWLSTFPFQCNSFRFDECEIEGVLWRAGANLY